MANEKEKLTDDNTAQDESKQSTTATGKDTGDSGTSGKASTDTSSAAETPTSSAADTSGTNGSEASSAGSDTSSSASSAEQNSGSTAGGSKEDAESAEDAHPRVLTDEDYYNNEAFKALGLEKPKMIWDPESGFGYRPPDPDYIWVQYQLKKGEDLVYLYFKYGVRPRDVMNWNFIYDYNWQEKLLRLRIKRALLPHD